MTRLTLAAPWRALRSAVIFLLLAIYLFFGSLFSLLCVALTGRLDFYYRELRTGARWLLHVYGIRVRQAGSHAGKHAQRAIFMANHQSNLDPPLLLSLLTGHVAALAKESLFRIPFFGLVLRAGGFVPVPENGPGREAARRRMRALLRSNRSVLIFPEGQRHNGDGLLRFHPGAFAVAREIGAPIVPITINGTGRLMGIGQWMIQPGVAQVVYHAPVDPLRFESVEALVEAVWREVESGLQHETPQPSSKVARAPVLVAEAKTAEPAVATEP